MRLKLVHPKIDGFSVESTNKELVENFNNPSKKLRIK